MSKRNKSRTPRFVTVIGEGTRIRGDVIFSGGLYLEGRVEGNLKSREGDGLATLVVSEQGVIDGDVEVANLILDGVVNGDVMAGERVELAENARVTGKVQYRLLEMAMGAEVNGELVHRDDASGDGAQAAEDRNGRDDKS